MPKILRIPSSEELPEGAPRAFVEALFELYGEAGRPTLREIADQVEAINEASETGGTASRETVRRMLQGRVPASWKSTRVALMALCHFAERPFGEVAHAAQDGMEEFTLGNGLYTGRFDIYMKHLWSQALAHPDPR
ncbi:hypothetical protein OG749_17025 [Streptomyces nojiriensis]|uniref:hypothetical protein n=1 Tax=Streptomyces nojiriensis TaxID=66374 RepID=UPI002E16D359